jgi:hypothetical protein
MTRRTFLLTLATLLVPSSAHAKGVRCLSCPRDTRGFAVLC